MKPLNLLKRREFRRQGTLGIGSRAPLIVAGIVTTLVAVVFLVWSNPETSDEQLVVYCAHDAVYSKQILDEFTKQTGIQVAIRFDNEATKALGLVNKLIAEKDQPSCDVFWNNQVLGTLDLMDHDLLLPYKGSGFKRMPAGSKDANGYWVGFAARLRIFIVNTDKLEASTDVIDRVLIGNLAHMSVAKPLYGTTRSHYTVLWHIMGGDKLQEWHRETRERGLREVLGNSTSKNMVAEGVCHLGWTDTDDYFAASDDGKPVDLLPIRVGKNNNTICIPNTVAIIKGTRKLDQAKRLVDYLLSAETELALAASESRQIPLGPVKDSSLSAEVRQLKKWAADSFDLTTLGDARVECLRWLKAEYLDSAP